MTQELIETVDILRPGKSLVVAIDGPSGSGKSSVSKEVARRLRLAYLDTGAMYRALTWYCLDSGTDLDDGAAVEAAAENLPLEISTSPQEEYVRVGGTDVTLANRTAAGYVQRGGSDAWVPSGRTTLDATAFYQPTAHTDPFGNVTTLTYDSYDLVLVEVEDAVGNTTSATIDYRLLRPSQVTDANGKVLTSGLKRANDSVDVSGKPPLAVRLGVARAAQVSYNGQPVDVTPFTSGQTARMKLGQ